MIVDMNQQVLFGLNDGTHRIEETIEIAKQLVETGVTHVITVQHHHKATSREITERVEAMNSFLEKQNITLQILPGMRILLYSDMVEDLKKNNELFLTLNQTSKYILIELPCRHIPHFTDKLLFELQLLGYIPILANVEQNEELRNRPDRLYSLVQKGALAQVTADSIVGKLGRRMRKFSLLLIKHNLIHFISSAESYSNELLSAYQYLNKKVSDYYSNYFQENAIHIVNGTLLSPLQPQKIKIRRILRFL